VSNALEVVDSLAISLALPVAIVAFALCIFLFLLLLFFSYLFCTVHWACCCCFCLHCCCRYCILFICVCVCVKNLLLCVFIFWHCFSVCVCCAKSKWLNFMRNLFCIHHIGNNKNSSSLAEKTGTKLLFNANLAHVKCGIRKAGCQNRVYRFGFYSRQVR